MTPDGSPSDQPKSPASIAERLRANDAHARELGVELVETAAGTATVTMLVRPEMCNGLGMCHGGVLFTLADCALEYASNSHGRATVAASATMEFLRPATSGSRLTAVCTEQNRGRTVGHYDVEVREGRGRLVALFRGRTHEIGGPVLDQR